MTTQIILNGFENVPGMVIRVRNNGDIDLDASNVPLFLRTGNEEPFCQQSSMRKESTSEDSDSTNH